VTLPHSSVDSLYVHVPFCSRKCEYCAFYSEPTRGADMTRYVSCLEVELEKRALRFGKGTVFFGGGTPSLLPTSEWQRLLEKMQALDLLGAREWTIECNPATVSLEKARLWREFGINRISMGVQSLHEALLDRLGRVHSREMVFRSFETLRQAGFDNINVDLMFAIPGQTMEIWKATLHEAISLGSEHLSSYEVTFEEDTPLYDQMMAGEIDVNEELACEMYEALIDLSGQAGFTQYEVSNFARGLWDETEALPSRACRHNVNYWRGGFWHGLGPSASGYMDGTRTRNWASTQLYCALIEQGQDAVENRESLPAKARAGEIAAIGLRMNEGWDFQRFKDVTGLELREEWAEDIASLERDHLGERDESGFRLTRRGLRFADLAAERFIRSS